MQRQRGRWQTRLPQILSASEETAQKKKGSVAATHGPILTIIARLTAPGDFPDNHRKADRGDVLPSQLGDTGNSLRQTGQVGCAAPAQQKRQKVGRDQGTPYDRDHPRASTFTSPHATITLCHAIRVLPEQLLPSQRTSTVSQGNSAGSQEEEKATKVEYCA